MRIHTAAKSSFSLPPEEHARVLRLRRLLGARSNTEVVRRSLRLLEESLSREVLRERFKDAAKRVCRTTPEELRDLDHLTAEGLGDE